ncbi:cell division protein DedD [Candidatus Nomurabacteria bacterium RIFCSPLOWO2_01_FULL_42_17]|uniref:Cell division protein DedD n=1 Tax=Candidatus Nomurabacteria bacterium RIFCSPLOWO2_01_FULL_42_17 TaxID=1801780 RepID=A0A1F6XMT8_9BACT|nr:MAG: cell division protein DedD [Candidatus Nomurabacteria bacterium RIFCSPLOWO2_01_FULL_42_17]
MRTKPVKYIRLSWDEYFLRMVDVVGSRGTCDRGRSGAILVKDKRILATGYVGSPMGLPHCDEVGHDMHTVTADDGTVSRHCLRTSHAELNVIANAARFGVAIEGATLYCKMTPCYTCAKTIINAGIKRNVVLQDYHASAKSKKIFKKAGVKLEIINKKVESYKDQ